MDIDRGRRWREAVRAGSAALALLALLPPPSDAAGLAPLSPRPRLVLVVSVDQMRFDYLTRFKPLFRAGFRTLWERGAIFSNARYEFANTATGQDADRLLTEVAAPAAR